MSALNKLEGEKSNQKWGDKSYEPQKGAQREPTM